MDMDMDMVDGMEGIGYIQRVENEPCSYAFMRDAIILNDWCIQSPYLHAIPWKLLLSSFAQPLNQVQPSSCNCIFWHVIGMIFATTNQEPLHTEE